MQYKDTRSVAKVAHIGAAIFNITYAYTPLHSWQHALAAVQWVSFPLLIITGYWLTKGAKVWNYFSNI